MSTSEQAALLIDSSGVKVDTRVKDTRINTAEEFCASHALWLANQIAICCTNSTEIREQVAYHLGITRMLMQGHSVPTALAADWEHRTLVANTREAPLRVRYSDWAPPAAPGHRYSKHERDDRSTRQDRNRAGRSRSRSPRDRGDKNESICRNYNHGNCNKCNKCNRRHICFYCGKNGCIKDGKPSCGRAK